MTPWTRVPLKYVATANVAVLREDTDPDFEFRYIDISNVRQGCVNTDVPVMKFRAAPSRARRLAKPGDSLVSTVRTYLRAIAAVPYADQALVFSTGFAVLKAKSSLAPSFLAWYLQSDDFVARVEAESTGVSYPAITEKDLMRLDVPLPPLREQLAIADYLDRETARIDTLIEEQQKLIGLLVERQNALESSELGRVDGTRRTIIKRILRPLSRPALPGLGVITAFRDGQVTLRSNRRSDGYTFSGAEAGYQEIRPGDLVFHALDGFAGAIGVSDSHGNATPVYHVCEVVGDNDLRYIARKLRFLGKIGFLATQAPNVRERSVDFRNWGTFARLPIDLPLGTEQERVVAYLSAHEAKVGNLIDEAQRLIDLSQERRSTLISAAMTGQIDIQAGAA